MNRFWPTALTVVVGILFTGLLAWVMRLPEDGAGINAGDILVAVVGVVGVYVTLEAALFIWHWSKL